MVRLKIRPPRPQINEYREFYPLNPYPIIGIIGHAQSKGRGVVPNLVSISYGADLLVISAGFPLENYGLD